MTGLVADRFLLAGRQWLDLATGRSVSLHVVPAGCRDEEFAWSLRCETLANLRHDLLNPLVDFGAIDRARRFEAYARRGPLRASGRTAAVIVRHAMRFLRAHDLAVESPRGALALRPLVGEPAPRTHPLGLVLQRRGAYEALLETLDVAHPAGVSHVAVVGPPQSGLRTLWLLVARAARLQGYVPVAGGVLTSVSGIADLLIDRHVCILGNGAASREVAAFVARIGAASSRRHLLIEFVRDHDGRALRMDRMGVGAMTAMVYVDDEFGPAPEAIFEAARRADGRPGLFAAQLAGAAPDEFGATASIARETAPAYGAERHAPAGTGRVNDVLLRAGARAERLARSGRHAAAARVLSRAVRVLAARHGGEPAADAALRLGGLALDRGMPARALSAFTEARDLASSTVPRICAAIGAGSARLLEARVADAEAAFRSAVAAAVEAREPAVHAMAAAKLADCLVRQSRHDEAETVLDEAPAGTSAIAELAAVRTAVHLARGRTARAMQCAALALEHARRGRDPRARLAAQEAVARAHAAAGDFPAARAALDAGLQEARQAHFSFDALRLRVLAAEILPESPHRLPHARHLPPLLRDDLTRLRERAPGPLEVVTELEAMLLLAQGADDDRVAVEKTCEALLRQSGARSVLVVGRPPGLRQLGAAGKPWPGESTAALRVLAGERRAPADPASLPCQAAEPVRYGGELIAAIACRFAAGAAVHPDRVAALLRAAALATAPAVRGLLDRTAAASSEATPGDLLGDGAAMRALREAVGRAARAPFPVLVQGESGSGKELVARAIHRLGPRRERRFCAVNCAALSDDLLEAELFGHARGAFTGAVGERAGLFEDADGGTLFLDEVGELSPRAQAKLLRVLQDGEVRRVGENVARRVDVRVVAATNRRLEAEVVAGRFRADLRFRLDVVRLEVPPLRDRVEDIPQLALRFWADAVRRMGSQATLAPDALAALARYDWPGNVRELQNAIAWMAVHSPRRGRVGPAALPAQLAVAGMRTATSLETAREEFERRFVRAALASANGQRGRAAEAMGVTRQGLAKMLRRLGIEAP